MIPGEKRGGANKVSLMMLGGQGLIEEQRGKVTAQQAV